MSNMSFEDCIYNLPVDGELMDFFGGCYNGTYKNVEFNGNIYRCSFAYLDNGAGAVAATEFRVISLHYHDNEVINEVFGEVIRTTYSSIKEIDEALDAAAEAAHCTFSTKLKFVD